MSDRAQGEREATILQGGRWKAYRPLSRQDRLAALSDGLAAYDRGEYFEAHELLEPAWMGTDDLPERAFYQGLIKLAAGHVHLVRGNHAGFAKNLAGARSRLDEAIRGGADDAGLDLPALLAAIDRSIAAAGEMRRAPDAATLEPIVLPRRA